jgi:uncharacterized protein
VLTQLKPEFDRQADEMVEIAAQVYVKQLSEQDLKAADAFFESPAGKKYVETQPAFLTEVVTAMQGWQSRLSTDMMTRVCRKEKEGPRDLIPPCDPGKLGSCARFWIGNPSQPFQKLGIKQKLNYKER